MDTDNLAEKDYYKKWLEKLPLLPPAPIIVKKGSREFWVGWIGPVSGVLTILTTLISGICGILSFFYQSEYYSFVTVWACILVVSIIAVCICYNTVLYRNQSIDFCERTQKHWEKVNGVNYSPVMYYFHFVSHVTRDHIAKVLRGDKVSIETTLENYVNSVAECLSVVTGHRCRCCIKEAKESSSKKSNAKKNTSNVVAKVICRDAHTRELTATSVSEDKKEHPLSNNTDFAKIWGDDERVYVCNNLQEAFVNQEYENSSIDKSKIKINNGVVSGWHLPYNSTMVVPIRSDFLFPNPKSRYDSSYECWGFLCVDSNETNVFVNECLVELTGSFADLLFCFLKVIEKTEKEQNVDNATIPS